MFKKSAHQLFQNWYTASDQIPFSPINVKAEQLEEILGM